MELPKNLPLQAFRLSGESMSRNPNNVTAEEVQQFANSLNEEMGRFDKLTSIEIHNIPFQNYLYEYFGFEQLCTPLEMETVYWDNAAPGRPTENIELLLNYLNDTDIRTAVISNMPLSGEALSNRINSLLPNNYFEFIIASSEYVFKKPHKRIFEIAVRKANLDFEDIWFCGDSIEFDIEGARMSDIAPVWYKGAIDSDGVIPRCNCIEVADWIELIDILGGAENGN